MFKLIVFTSETTHTRDNDMGLDEDEDGEEAEIGFLIYFFFIRFVTNNFCSSQSTCKERTQT